MPSTSVAVNERHRQQLKRHGVPVKRRLMNVYLTNRLLRHVKKRSVLELGPGYGSLYPHLRKRFNVIHGIDVNPKRVVASSRAGYQMHEGDISNLTDHIDSTFDVILSRHVLEHVDAPTDVLVKHLYDATSWGGWNLHEVPVPPYHQPAHVKELYPHEWARAFQKAGFTVYDLHQFNRFGLNVIQIKARRGNLLEWHDERKWWKTLGVA